jgi:putative transposase
MRPSRFTDAEILKALQEVRNGTTAAAVCRRIGITQTTFYRWRARHEGEAGRESPILRELREENRKLKVIVADLLLEKQERARTRRSST